MHVALGPEASLGLAVGAAHEFARRGSSVAVHFNASEEQSREVVAFTEAGGGRATTLQADLAQGGCDRRLNDQASQRFGRGDRREVDGLNTDSATPAI